MKLFILLSLFTGATISSCCSWLNRGIKIPIFKSESLETVTNENEIRVQPHTMGTLTQGVGINGLSLGVLVYLPKDFQKAPSLESTLIKVIVEKDIKQCVGNFSIKLDSLPKYLPLAMPVDFKERKVDLDPENLFVTIDSFNYKYKDTTRFFPRQRFKVVY